MKVRAVKRCYAAESLREVGDEFDVPDGTPLYSKGRSKDPVMEKVGEGQRKPPPPPGRRLDRSTESEQGDE